MKNVLFICLIGVCLLLINGHMKRSYGIEKARLIQGTKGTLLAEFDGRNIYEGDISSQKVFEAEKELYLAKLRHINAIIEKRVLKMAAKEQGVSVEEFLHQNTKVKVAEDEIEKFAAMIFDGMDTEPALKGLSRKAQENKILEKLQIESGPSKSFQDLVREAILKERLWIKRELAREDFLERLKKKYNVKIYLAEPDPPSYDIPTANHPSLGLAKAPVTIVVFNDFECPYCAKVAVPLRQLVETFPSKVRLVFRHFPLAIHQRAQEAHEAAALAHEQGQFWAYHDSLFTNQKNIEIEDLKRYAENLGLDMVRFNQGLLARKYKAKVKRDIEEGLQYGVRGTPTIFINGKQRQSRTGDYFSDLSRYIEAELRHTAFGDDPVTEVQPEVLAEFDGGKIIQKDLSPGAFYDQEKRLYETKLNQVKKLIEPMVIEAIVKRSGVPFDILYQERVDTRPTHEDVRKQFDILQGYVEKNPRLMFLTKEEREKEILRLLKVHPDPSTTFEELITPNMKEIARRYKLKHNRPIFINKLIAEADVKIHLEAPKPPVYAITTEGYPSIGPSDAPVTIVEFGDFQCPFCANVGPILNQALIRHSGKIRLVFRHFPLKIHENAQKAHEASECAHEQRKFWEYHDIMFANQGALGVKHLKQYAADLGLDVVQFNRCLDTGKYADKVSKSFEEAQAIHVRGTPSFYINGTPRSIQTYEQLAWYITEGNSGEPASISLHSQIPSNLQCSGVDP